jgi:hypothetical protein
MAEERLSFCKRCGKYTERYKNRGCKICASVLGKKYKEENKNKIKEEKQQYYKDNKSRYAEYHQKNKKKRNEYNREYYKRVRKNDYVEKYNKWHDFLKSIEMGKCTICSYSNCMAAIEYHHLRDKEFNISSFFIKKPNEKNRKLLLKELKKCVALCKICHAELHVGYGIFIPRSEQ